MLHSTQRFKPGAHPADVARVSAEPTVQPQAARAKLLERQLAEQRTLTETATSVARGTAAEQILPRALHAAASLSGASSGLVLRLRGAQSAEVLAAYGDAPDVPLVGAILDLQPDGPVRRMTPADRVVRTDERLSAPVVVGGGVWGALALTGAEEGPFAEDRIAAFAELAGLAVAAAAARDRLFAAAAADPLTGLLNHRAFHERLDEETARAQRHGRPLALAIVDVDGFRALNDSVGHAAADEVLVEIARRLCAAVRAEDVVARVGHDQYALLLPETTKLQALALVERGRRSVSASPMPAGRWVTLSAGIADLDDDADGEIYRLTDRALYWSKANGRDRTWLYDADVVRELSAEERDANLERGQALMGVKALARAIDAKDPATSQHSDRVARIAVGLAGELGWSPDRIALLREAALVHDVGKLGVSDQILLKPALLTAEEQEAMRTHAPLGAEIAGEVLEAEQVAWVRHHHERPDGRGYPDGLIAEEIPPGAALIALADSLDVMVSDRPYSRPKSWREAIDECQALAGRQFDPDAVRALLALASAGAIA
ncbi:MAG: diguanylate cyclase [Solirubrobacteraceae bacterium]